MSKSYDLKSLFGNIPKDTRALMGDDYVTGFHVYDLPRELNVEDFSAYFTDRIIAINPAFPPTLCLQGSCIMRNSAGIESKTTLMQIIFKLPADADVVSPVLIDALERGLIDRGFPKSEEGYGMEAKHDLDFDAALLRLTNGDKGPSANP